MFASVFPQVGSSPSLVWVVTAMGLNIVNLFIGLGMALQNKKKTWLRTHLVMYISILVCLTLYLVMHGIHSENSVWDYAICLYFITLVPISRKWDVMYHGLVTVLGLILLPVLILLQMF